jgi:mycothiol synthase
MLLRRPDPEKDFDEVLAVLQACDRAAYGDSDWTAAELRQEWEEIDLQQDAWVAEVNARIAGLIQIYDHHEGLVEADGYVHPDCTGQGVGMRLLDAVETRALDFSSEVPQGGCPRVRISHLVGDERAPALMGGRGYVRVRTFFRMVIDVDSGLPGPRWSDGVVVKPFDVSEHGRQLHEADERAFTEEWGRQPLSYEAWAKKFLDRPGFDPAIVVVAWDDAEIAGFALNQHKHMGDWGFVRSLGVSPEWRRRGLGLALLQESFRRFAESGEKTVALGVDSENPTGATRLYEHAGMRQLWRADVWEKALRAGD